METHRPSEDDPPLDRDFTCQEDNVTYEALSLGPLKEKEIKNKSQHFFGCFFTLPSSPRTTGPEAKAQRLSAAKLILLSFLIIFY